MVPSIISSTTAAITGIAISWTRSLRWPILCGALCYLVGNATLCAMHRGQPWLIYPSVLLPSSMGQGLQFPGSLIAILAVSSQEDQAVVTSTLLLWRSLGMVLGVALSSFIVQNALVYYLDLFVIGVRRNEIISLARSSVQAVANLEAPYRDQVIRSYESALWLMFVGCTILAAISLLVVSPVRLPPLPSKR